MRWNPRRIVEALVVLVFVAGSVAVSWAAVQVFLSPEHGPAIVVAP